MKLSRLILNLKDAHLAEEMVRTLHDYEILRANLPQVFPSTDIVEELLTVLRPTVEQKKEKLYNEDNLPLHTRDDEWMTEYMSRSLAASPIFFEDPKVKFKNIRSFIKIDPEYHAERDRYEQDVIRVEIQDLISNNLTVNDKGLVKSKINKSTNADEVFYNELLNKMLAFGMEPHSIEVGLEKNADLWRQQMMEITFINKYLRPLAKSKDNLPSKQYIAILDQVAGQRPEWMGLREYNYYQKHQRVINELGTATDNMKIKPHEAFIKEMAWQTKYQDTVRPLLNNIQVCNNNQNFKQNNQPIIEQ